MFSQKHELRVDPAELLRSTRRYFDAELEVLAETTDGRGSALRVRLSTRAYAGEFVVRVRPAEPDDLERAQRAELAGRAAGMATLAARCPTVWLIHGEQPHSEPALLNLCAILAAVALGPVLPDDDSTLYGVRGAMERAKAAS